MSIHATKETSRLPASICNHCDWATANCVGLDIDNEFADEIILECAYSDQYEIDCPLSAIDWKEFIKEIHDELHKERTEPIT